MAETSCVINGYFTATVGFHPIDWLLVALVVVLLVTSGLLALAETSLVRTSKVKAQSLVGDRRRGARPLARLVEHPEQFLNPVLLLVLICQLVSATLIGVLAEQWFGAVGVLVATVFEVIVIFVVFEAVPKNWAVHNPEKAALFTAPIVDALIRFPPVRAASTVLIGLSDLLLGRRDLKSGSKVANVTESELLAMADVAHEEEVIEPEERAFIHSIIDFGDTVVREVMIPRPDMVAVESRSSVADVLGVALTNGFSRLPIFDQNLDEISGVAHIKDLIKVERKGHRDDRVSGHLRPANFVPETKHLSQLLHEMQESKFHLAIVVDEYGSTVGLVTLEDVIEELVGEIVDEFDVETPLAERLDDGSVIVSGMMPVDDASELLGADLPEGAWDTVGGLVLDLAGRVPREGETVEVDGFHLVVQRVQRRRIGRVKIVPHGADVNDSVADGLRS
ncbi:MAG: hemolysin family protein [Acidimicrobiales bacterium]|jgi:CBS domain containing-hemolysin-like protein